MKKQTAYKALFKDSSTFSSSHSDQTKIKLITLKRKRIGTNYEWSVTFTATTTAPSKEKQHKTDLACAVNFDGSRQKKA